MFLGESFSLNKSKSQPPKLFEAKNQDMKCLAFFFFSGTTGSANIGSLISKYHQ